MNEYIVLSNIEKNFPDSFSQQRREKAMHYNKSLNRKKIT